MSLLLNCGIFEERNIFISTLVFAHIRGHSSTTWTELCHFLTPPLLRGQFLYPERGQKQIFLTPSPPSSCLRSYRMTPYYKLRGVRFFCYGNVGHNSIREQEDDNNNWQCLLSPWLTYDASTLEFVSKNLRH